MYTYFYDFYLIDSKIPKKFQAPAASVQPKIDNIKGSASYTIKEPPIKFKQTPKYNTKTGMLIQNHNQSNIR